MDKSIEEIILIKDKKYRQVKGIMVMDLVYKGKGDDFFWFNTINGIPPKGSCWNIKFDKIDRIQGDRIILKIK